ncbi:MAG: hypothetical protein JNL58_20620 [Planctomyces sp.]|nr:hypothetical protein [Planctomyces sp.]
MVKTHSAFFNIATLALLGFMGCQQQAEQTSSQPITEATPAEADGPENSSSGEAEIDAAIAELDPADQAEARSQKFCAVMTTSRLGSMGTPLKLEVNGQPVFVCCAGCKSKATKNPDATLATVAKLKAENSGGQK